MGILLLSGLLGMIFHLLAKMQTLRNDFKVANQEFVYSKFFKDESIAIASSIVFIVIMALVLPEILTLKPSVEDYVRILFVMGGALGSWAFGYFLGKSKKYIRNVIDIKTNIADGKTDEP